MYYYIYRRELKDQDTEPDLENIDADKDFDGKFNDGHVIYCIKSVEDQKEVYKWNPADAADPQTINAKNKYKLAKEQDKKEQTKKAKKKKEPQGIYPQHLTPLKENILSFDINKLLKDTNVAKEADKTKTTEADKKKKKSEKQKKKKRKQKKGAILNGN